MQELDASVDLESSQRDRIHGVLDVVGLFVDDCCSPRRVGDWQLQNLKKQNGLREGGARILILRGAGCR